MTDDTLTPECFDQWEVSIWADWPITVQLQGFVCSEAADMTMTMSRVCCVQALGNEATLANVCQRRERDNKKS